MNGLPFLPGNSFKDPTVMFIFAIYTLSLQGLKKY